MKIEKTTKTEEVKTEELVLSDLPVNEDDTEVVNAGVGAALHVKPLIVDQ